MLCRNDYILSGSSFLILSPHPDDETMGCGQLIAKCIAEKKDVTVIVVSDGSQSHLNCCSIDKNTLVTQRRKSCIRALEHLGVPKERIIFLNFPDSYLKDYTSEIVAELQKVFPVDDVCLFAPHPLEGWSDHLAVTNAGLSFAKTRKCKLFYYAVWFYVSGAISYRTIASMNFNKVMKLKDNSALKKKKRALNEYKKSVASCGKPYAGALPDALWKNVVAGKEIFFEAE